MTVMGYTTDFYGRFTLDRPLTPEHAAYLRAFAGSRRMRRDAAKTRLMEDPVRKAVGLAVGTEGGYFVGEADHDYGQHQTPDVLDYNQPPAGQPGLWCKWGPTEDNAGIEWDGGEKFYNYVEWLNYIIQHFLAPAGYVLSGSVEWAGEDRSDFGTIVVTDNVVEAREGVSTHGRK